MEMMINRRIVYLDNLRIFAILSVITIHVTATRLNIEELGSYNWIVMNIFNKCVQYAVPVFVMISGALLLCNEISIKKIYSKMILRIVCAYLFWNLFYATSHNIVRPLLTNEEVQIQNFIDEMVNGRYHLWYCRMIIGLYILIPICRKIVKCDELLRYTLIVLLIFSIVIPSIKQCYGMEWLVSITNNMGLDSGKYIFYFLLGYYISQYKGEKNRKKIIEIIGGLALLCTSVLTTYISCNKMGIIIENIKYLEDIFIVGISIAIFVIFKESKYLNIENSISVYVANRCFGIYLVHDYFVGGLDSLGLTTVCINPILAIPGIVIIVFALSFFVTCICRKIPVIGKYIS